MSKDNLVTVKTFSNIIDAQVAQEHLTSHRIKAMIKKDDSGGMRPHLQYTQGVAVVVFEKDAEKAREVLAAMNV